MLYMNTENFTMFIFKKYERIKKHIKKYKFDILIKMFFLILLMGFLVIITINFYTLSYYYL